MDRQEELTALAGIAGGDPSAESRDRTIVRTSIIGIVANVFLAAFKAVVGLLSGSIAIVLDAVNNLSDAASSVITIVGTKLAARPADKKHPFGYGRVEYLSAMIISLLVLYAGITSFTESVKAILHPEEPDYSTAALVIVAAGVVVKILLGRYVKGVGEKVHSDSLVNSGEDATLDSVISASTLVAAIIFLVWGLSLEAWLGAVISLVIIKSGVEMLRDTLSQILGERAEPQLAREIKKTVCAFPGVSGAYDLVLNNYGPDRYNGSIHIEVPDTCSADELDELIRAITAEVYRKHDVILTAIGVYSMNTRTPQVTEMRKAVYTAVHEVPHILQIHGFYVNLEEKAMRFDLVVSFDSPDRGETYRSALEKVKALYPDYTVYAAMDTDFSEE